MSAVTSVASLRFARSLARSFLRSRVEEKTPSRSLAPAIAERMSPPLREIRCRRFKGSLLLLLSFFFQTTKTTDDGGRRAWRERRTKKSERPRIKPSPREPLHSLPRPETDARGTLEPLSTPVRYFKEEKRARLESADGKRREVKRKKRLRRRRGRRQRKFFVTSPRIETRNTHSFFFFTSLSSLSFVLSPSQRVPQLGQQRALLRSQES